jgi:hypothetical protein
VLEKLKKEMFLGSKVRLVRGLMLKIPHCLDNRLIDGGKVVSPTITILDIFHRPVFHLKLTEPYWFVRTSQETY